MKILALSNLYPPNAVGGYETLCHEVMSALAARGHEVAVLTSSYGGGVVEYPRQKVLRLLTLPAAEGNIYEPFVASGKQRAAIEQENLEILRRVLRDEDPDLVFVWNLYFLDPSLLSALDASGCRLVYLLTDNWLIASCNPAFISDYFAHEVYGASGPLQKLLRRLRRHLRPSSVAPRIMQGAAIFASRFMQRLYRDAGFSFRDETVIYHGVAPRQRLDELPVDRSQPVVQGELNLLFAGRLVRIKGVHTAIEALPMIARALPGTAVRLTIVGDDRDRPYVESLRERVQQLALNDMVVFLPPVPEDSLPALFARHDIYLFPSLYEPFSLTLIHALQAGIPTAASKAGGNPEIVQHRQTGLLFTTANPADFARQVVDYAESPRLRCEVSGEAAAYAGDFTFERMIGQIESYLQGLRRELP